MKKDREIIELPDKLTVTLLKADKTKLQRLFEYDKEHDITSTLEQTASVLLSKAINETIEMYEERQKLTK